MTFSQDEQAAAARADSEQPQEQTAPLKETSNEPTQLPIDEAFDLDRSLRHAGDVYPDHFAHIPVSLS